MKSLRSVSVLLLFVVSFLIACQKPNTPASSSENPNTAATGGEAGSATAGDSCRNSYNRSAGGLA